MDMYLQNKIEETLVTEFLILRLMLHQGVLSTHSTSLSYEPRCEKTSLPGFRQGPTQTRLYSHRRWLEARNFGFRK